MQPWRRQVSLLKDYLAGSRTLQVSHLDGDPAVDRVVIAGDRFRLVQLPSRAVVDSVDGTSR